MLSSDPLKVGERGPDDGYKVSLDQFREDQQRLRREVGKKPVETHADLYHADPTKAFYDRGNFVWTATGSGLSRYWTCPQRALVKPRGQGYYTEYGPFTTERKPNMAIPLMSATTVAARKRLLELEKELAALKENFGDLRPAEPAAADSVVRFRKYRRTYVYAAIRTGSHWYVTQDGTRSARQGVPPKTWDELTEWIGPQNWDTIEVLS